MRVTLWAVSLGVACGLCFPISAQDIEQSRGIDARVNYPSLARFGPWDDRNYDLSAEDLEWLAPNEAELRPKIPLFFRIELRKEWPHLQRTGTVQYPRAARQLFEIRHGGLMRNGVIERREARAAGERTPITNDGEIQLNDVLGADEITVEINPVDPTKVIAGSNSSPWGQKMYYSSDGGVNWAIGDQGAPDGLLDNTCCDPTVGWSSDGTIAYAAALNDSVGVNFYRSTDFGQNWGAPNVLTASGSDKEFLHVDISSTSPYKDNVYLTWHDGNTMQFARSVDLGLNFTIKAFDGTAGQLAGAPSGIGSDITTDSAGNIYYLYAAFGPRTIELLKSTDGGVSFAAPTTVASTNGSFIFPVPSMETREAWVYAAADCDRSGGPFDGTIYCAWTDTSALDDCCVATQNHTRVVVARSSDGGTSWQTSIPHPTADIDTVDRYNQWLTVDDNGIVHVVFYDTRHSVNRTGVDLYYANSDDGGVTWNTEERISTFTSDNVQNAQEWGDYNGISVMGGRIITTWTDNTAPAASSTDVYAAPMTLVLLGPPSATSIAPTGTGPTNADSIDFVVTFSEDVVNFDDATDLIVSHTGTASTGAAISGGPVTYTASVTGITGDGSFTAAVDTTSDVQDTDAEPLASSVTSAAVTIDNTPPAISISAPSLPATDTGPVSFAVAYTDAVAVTLVPGDVTLNATGDAAGTVGVSGSGAAQRTVTIDSVTGDGTLGISLAAATANDVAGNLALAAGPSATFDAINNRPPVLDPIGDRQVAEGANLTIAVTASDADNDTLTFSVSNLPTGASFDQATNTFSWVPAAADVGTFSGLLFTVTDDALRPLSDSESVSITVNAREGGGGGGCFIATAAYGTPLAEDLAPLRALRDRILLPRAAGTAFVDTYYRLSPPVADFIADSPLLRAVVRAGLGPVVRLAEAINPDQHAPTDSPSTEGGSGSAPASAVPDSPPKSIQVPPSAKLPPQRVTPKT